MTPIPESPICDFCSSMEVRWVYPCPDIEDTRLHWRSVGAWAACDPCSDFIEGGDWDGLINRTLVVLGKNMANPYVRKRQRTLYETFAGVREPRYKYGTVPSD